MKIEYFLLLTRCHVLGLENNVMPSKEFFFVHENNIPDLRKQIIGSYDFYYNVCGNSTSYGY
jgi:hypothetical protein